MCYRFLQFFQIRFKVDKSVRPTHNIETKGQHSMSRRQKCLQLADGNGNKTCDNELPENNEKSNIGPKKSEYCFKEASLFLVVHLDKIPLIILSGHGVLQWSVVSVMVVMTVCIQCHGYTPVTWRHYTTVTSHSLITPGRDHIT